jgi:hypothetical protein
MNTPALLLLSVLMIVPMMLPGCGGGSNQTALPASPKPVGALSVRVEIPPSLRGTRRDGLTVDSVWVSVSAPDIYSITVRMVYVPATGVATGSVSGIAAGKGRSVAVSAKSADGAVLLAGTATTDVVAGEVSNVSIILETPEDQASAAAISARIDPVSARKFLAGVNLPWLNAFWDVGRNPYGTEPGGFSHNRPKLDADFAYLSSKSVEVMRVFLFGDLRTGVEFDANGHPTGLDEYALADVQALFDSAREHRLWLIPVLFSFELADGVSSEGGARVGEHPDLIADAAKRALLVQALSPLLKQVGGDSAVLAWDVMNEPNLAKAVTPADMASFLRAFVDEIHASTSQRATVGCQTRAELDRVRSLGLDLYSFHAFDKDESAYPLDYPVASLILDKPCLVTELEPTRVGEKLTSLEANGYAGGLFWSLNAGDGFDFRAVADEFDSWWRGQ